MTRVSDRGQVPGPPAPLGEEIAPFRAAWWLRGRHAQTIVGRMLRRTSGAAFRRERLETPDGDFLDLDFVEVDGFASVARDPRQPIVLVLHGLEGSAQTGYAYEAYRALARSGLRVVGLNFRSCSGVPNRTKRFYHSGETRDLGFVLRSLAERYPDVPRGVVGFSLGGNVLLKFLGESGAAARTLLTAAVAISVPFDLAGGAAKLEQGMGRVYTGFFLRKLRRKLRLKRATLEGAIDLETALRAGTIRQIDDLMTAPIHGFRDADHYYAQSSSAQFLNRIESPTLILHAVDDPFVPVAAVPHGCDRTNPWLETRFPARGGHVGFVSGTPWAPQFWAEEQAAAYLARRLRGASAA